MSLKGVIVWWYGEMSGGERREEKRRQEEISDKVGNMQKYWNWRERERGGGERGEGESLKRTKAMWTTELLEKR